MVIPEKKDFVMPECLKCLPGKFIYFSLGSMGSADLDLMNMLIDILGRSKNKFIVSKGVLDDQIKLKPNMWGEKFLPQRKILSMVDLFITHGGNFSITESLYFGKPMIVLPIFADQHDNGMRITEKKLGHSIQAHKVTDDILTVIEDILANQDMKIRLKTMSKRIQKSRSLEVAVDKIEQIAKDFKFQNTIVRN